jgi:low affinity Fe/Cu permease
VRPPRRHRSWAGSLRWIVSGPLFGISDTWQTVITSGTGVVTFPIQTPRNRATAAVQRRLHEPIRATAGARNAPLDPEDPDKAMVEEFGARHGRMARQARDRRAPPLNRS